MQHTKIYDVIIIGASKQGLALAELLENTGSVALVSSNFVHKSKKQPLPNTDLIENEVIYLSYIHGLFGVSLNNKDSLFGKRLVFATGTKPKKLNLKNPKTFSEKLNLSRLSNPLFIPLLF